MTGVLVTGATTPLGCRLVQALLEEPAFGTVLAVGAEVEPPPVEAPSARLVYERVDLTRPREVQSLLFGPVKRLGLTQLVHTALHRSAADAGPRVHALNVASTRELLDAAERHPTLRQFVFRSHADVYRIDPRRAILLDEQDPLDLSAHAPQRVRDRVEADVTVCTRMGLSPLTITVLRCAEILAPSMGSQFHDYLASRVCLRPLGFDPMLNLLTLEDAARALVLALRAPTNGIFNVPGADTLPLSRAITLWGKTGLAVPGPMLAPLYAVRASALGMEFRYDMNHRRFHFSAILDGRRARDVLGYRPERALCWPARRARGLSARIERPVPGSSPDRRCPSFP
jgi:UDP-glucose 4-epimerase